MSQEQIMRAGGQHTHVSQAECNLFFGGRLTNVSMVTFEGNLATCPRCRKTLADVAKYATQLAGLSRQHSYSGQEKQREPRISSNGTGLMRILNPFSERFHVQLLNVSRNGLKIKTGVLLEPGVIVHMRLADSLILGEVRYCVTADDAFHAGIQIQDMRNNAGSSSAPEGSAARIL
jgi:hypothetical protein